MEEIRPAGSGETSALTNSGSERALAPSAAADAVAADGNVVAVADRIAEVARRDTIVFALKIGKLVADGLYGGDPHGWRGDGENRVSLRDLIRLLRERRCMSRATLHRRLAVHEVLCDDERISTLRQVEACHLWEVLSLPRERRWELLVEADALALPVRDFHQQVAPELPKRARRAALRSYVRVVGRFASFLRQQPTLKLLNNPGAISAAKVRGVLDNLVLVARAAADQARVIAAANGLEPEPPFRSLCPDGSPAPLPKGEEGRTIEALALKVQAGRKGAPRGGAR